MQALKDAAITMDRTTAREKVAEYLKSAGLELVPVPVYYPEATEILGRPVYRTVAAIPGAVDLVNVFRRPNDVPPHVALPSSPGSFLLRMSSSSSAWMRCSGRDRTTRRFARHSSFAGRAIPSPSASGAWGSTWSAQPSSPTRSGAWSSPRRTRGC